MWCGMRVLMAVQDSNASKRLSKIFAKGGFFAEPAGGSNLKDIRREMKSGDYPVLVYDEALADCIQPEGYASISVQPYCAANKTSKSIHPSDNASAIFEKLSYKLAEVYGRASDGVIKAGPYEADLVNKQAKINGTSIKLTKMQFNVFRFLCLRQGGFVKTQQIAEHIYGLNSEKNKPEKAIEVHICRINKRIKEAAGEGFSIKSQGWQGYQFPTDRGRNDSKSFTFGPVKYDAIGRKIICGEKSQNLSPKQCDLIELLRGKYPVQSDVLKSHLNIINYQNLKVQIGQLRKKIKEISGENYLFGRHGQGYQLCDAPAPNQGQKPKILAADTV